MTRNTESIKPRTARLLKSTVNKKVLFLLIDFLIKAEEAITL